MKLRTSSRHLFKYTLFIVFLLLFSCKKDHLGPIYQGNNTNNNGTPIHLTEGDTIVYIRNEETGTTFKAKLVIPEADGPLPAIVVMHGCGGLWAGDDTAGSTLESHFASYSTLLKQEKYVAIFIDSYSARGIVSFCNVTPPDNIPCAAEFIRPRDAYAALNYLRTKPYVIKNKIGLLGFSHGGTSTLSTIVDANVVRKAEGELWSVSGYTQGVLPPAERPAEGGFATAVSYYPGAGFYSYYGSPSNPSSGKYAPYAPVLIHAAGEDPLYTNGSSYQTLLAKAALNGSGEANKNQMIMYVYEGANHSFDGVTGNSIDGQSSELARQRTMDWFRTYLK